MIRYERIVIVGLMSLCLTLALASIGRTEDWSPFGLTFGGWLVGLAAGWSICVLNRRER